MQVPVWNTAGQQVSTVDLPEDIFGVEVNVGLMHQHFVRQMANARQGTHKTKSRGEVARTKAKWYRQKGTGRARHGSRNAPIFVGGGVAHGPKPRDYSKKMPKKMRRGALRSLLSAVLRDEQLIIVDQFEVTESKTKAVQEALQNLVQDASAIVLLADKNDNVERGARNLANAMTLRVQYLNIRDVLKHDKVILTLDSLEIIKNWLGTAAQAPAAETES